jgi:hypothetical protein
MRPFRNLALNEFGAAVLRENRVEPRRAGDIEGNDMITAAGQRLYAVGAGRPPCHIGLMGELPTYRVAVRARKEPAGTYTYVITRIDDPNWAESTGESYSTPEAASEAGWIALDRIRAVKKLDRS